MKPWSATLRKPVAALTMFCLAASIPGMAGAQTRQAKTSISEFVTAPFPIDGTSSAAAAYFNRNDGTNRGRETASGRVYWEKETYSDQRVLLHIPAKFDIRRPGVMVVFFHGHGAKLERDIRDRQALPEQISASVANAVLVAPQFAVDAADSNPGKFSEPGGFTRFLNEAATHLAILHGDQRSVRYFQSLPVIIVSYSGGYLATAAAITRGDQYNRVKGVVLLDSLYGEIEKFENWITTDRKRFFISTYLGSTRARNLELQRLLKDRNVPIKSALDRRLMPGAVVFISGGNEENHRDYVQDGWVANPITDLLNRLRDYKAPPQARAQTPTQ
ncbi:MAG: alpha/beta hydrolase [Xanthobacteraceae bacterium]|nr:alpha/beta hydrolase [Xanthobacteraceae bacterium]